MSTITMSIEQHDALVRELSAKSAECQRLRNALETCLKVLEREFNDGHVQQQARTALQEIQP